MEFTFCSCNEIEKLCVRCTNSTCCNSKKYHCPLCPLSKFKPNRLDKVISHIRSTHWKTRLQTLRGKYSLICRLYHGGSHKNHFHCPLCEKEILSKGRVLDHVQRCGHRKEASVETQVIQENGLGPVNEEVPVSSTLSTHMESLINSTDTVMKVQKPRRKTPCDECGTFLLKKNLAEHKRAKHENNDGNMVHPLTPRTKIACDVCGKLLFKKNLRKHKRSKHGVGGDKLDEQVLIEVNTEEMCAQPIPAPSGPEELQNGTKHQSRVEEMGGVLSDVCKALSYRPDEFQAFNNYMDVLMMERGNLTRADKKMIMTVMSTHNNYLYCIDAHGTLVRIYSPKSTLADQVAANLKTADLDDRMKAILEFAFDVNLCDELTEERLSTLQRHGLDRDDAWDIGAIAAFISMSNRLGFLSNMKPNPELVLTLGPD